MIVRLWRHGTESRTLGQRVHFATDVAALCALVVMMPLIAAPSAAQSKSLSDKATALPHQVSPSVSETSSAVTKRTVPVAYRTLQLSASYDAQGAHLSGSAGSFTVGSATEERSGAESEQLASTFKHTANNATYGARSLLESFHAAPGGIEQSFTIATRPDGPGPLVISVSLDGAIAKGSGQSIAIDNSTNGADIATYSNLSVIDAHRHVVPASMAATSDGTSIAITVRDAKAGYPLTIDPTWSTPSATIYVTGGNTQPVNTSTDTAGTYISHGGNPMLIAPGGSTGYEVNYATLGSSGWILPINLFTGDVSGTPIDIGTETGVNATIEPNGEYVALTYNSGIEFWSLATGTDVKIVRTTSEFGPMAVTPNNETLWIAGDSGALNYVAPLNLSTYTFGTSIDLPSGSGYSDQLVLSPDAETLYAVSSTAVTPISLTTDTAGTPISVASYNIGTLGIFGGSDAFAVNPDGETGYVVDNTSTVTPIDLVHDTVGTPISLAGLSGGAGDYLEAVAVSANGQTAFALSSSQWLDAIALATDAVTPIALSTAIVPYALAQQPVDSLVPQGSELTSAELSGGGSPSERCSCAYLTGAGVPTVHLTGDPVDGATGDFSESATDLTIPGAGIPLKFTRTYDAQTAQSEVANSASAGPLGYGWTDNLDMSVSYNSTTQTATVTEENGAQTAFIPYSSGTSPAWCSGSTNFCATAPDGGDAQRELGWHLDLHVDPWFSRDLFLQLCWGPHPDRRCCRRHPDLLFVLGRIRPNGLSERRQLHRVDLVRVRARDGAGGQLLGPPGRGLRRQLDACCELRL